MRRCSPSPVAGPPNPRALALPHLALPRPALPLHSLPRLAVTGLASAARLRAWTAGAKTLYVATSEEDSTRSGAEILAAAIREASPGGLVWHYLPLPEEHHSTIFPVAALRAFRTLFAVAVPAAAATAATPSTAPTAR